MSLQTRTKKESHYYEIDTARGIGIIAVILGHALKQTEQTNQIFDMLHVFLYSFHVPLLFILSGFVALKALDLNTGSSKADYIKTRAIRLMIPYIFISILYTPVKIYLSQYAIKPFELSSLKYLLIGESPDVSLWFLYVLFLSSIICALFVTRSNIKYFFCIGIILAYAYYSFGWSFRFPGYFVYFIAGIMLRMYYDRISRLIKSPAMIILCLILFAAGVSAIYLTGNELYTLITSFTMSALVLWISTHINSRLLTAFGKYSMDCYIMSEPIMTVVKLVFWNILHMGYIPCTILCFIISAALPIPISVLIIRKVSLFKLLILGIKDRKAA